MYQRLGQVPDTDPRWQRLLANYQWLNDHPLPDNADPDTVAERALVIAALVHAQNMLQGTDAAAADQAFQAANDSYNAFKAQQTAQETPSGLALWLSDLGLNIASPVAKVAGLAALVIGAVILAPVVTAAVGRAGASKSA